MLQIIGQKNTIEKINNLDEIPRFCIIEGPRGCGKRTVVIENFARRLQCEIVYVGCGVEDIRDLISTAYKVQEPIIYHVKNAERLSISARNSLLKLCEEPPRNAYVVLTSDTFLNETLRSRAWYLKMEEYSEWDFEEYIKLHNLIIPGDNNDKKAFCSSLCSLSELQYLIDSKECEKFIKLSNSIIDNIAEVTYGNAYKLSTNFRTKADGDGIEFITFLGYFISKLLILKKQIPEEILKPLLASSLKAHSKYNKVYAQQPIIDEWVSEILRKIDE